MKRTTKRTGIILIVIAALCITCSISPTLGFQVPFNQRIWKHHPVKKIRYYVLKPDVFIGLAMYSLEITFNEDGSFKSAGVSYSD